MISEKRQELLLTHLYFAVYAKAARSNNSKKIAPALIHGCAVETIWRYYLVVEQSSQQQQQSDGDTKTETPRASKKNYCVRAHFVCGRVSPVSASVRRVIKCTHSATMNMPRCRVCVFAWIGDLLHSCSVTATPGLTATAQLCRVIQTETSHADLSSACVAR